MRTVLILLALLFAHPLAAQSANGTLGAHIQLLPADGVHLAEGARIERGRVSARLILKHRSRPHLALAPRPGDPPCSVTSTPRAGGELQAELRCTPAAPGPQIVRLLIVPAA